MTTYSALFGAADEAALIALIDAAQTVVGTTVVNAATSPAGSSWYLSTGRGGLHWIVTGVVKNAGNSISAFCAADFNNAFGGIGLAKSGYVNHDPNALVKVPPYTAGADRRVPQTSGTTWLARDALSAYTGRISASPDALSLTCDYQSGGVATQGVLYIGRTRSMQAELYRQARAKVVSSTLVGGSQYTIELDRNINAALKDTGVGGATYPDDPAQQKLLFQPRIVDNTGTNGTGFAMTERAQIVPGTLGLTGGGNTKFDVNTTGGVKLFTAACRYNTAGVDLTQDLVSVASETNVAICASANTGAQRFNPVGGAATQSAIGAWDGMGGQRADANNCLDLYLTNRKSTNAEAFSAPNRFSGRWAWYPIYAMTYDVETSKITQAANEGARLEGVLDDVLIMTANDARPDNSKFYIDSKTHRAYRIMQKIALGLPPPGNFGADCCYANGPSF